nr:amyloid beta A4 precursor protein-binding family B member 1-interacting protein-like [Chlorocebus sabaeus]
MPQAAHSVSAVLQEAQTHAETSKDRKPALGNHQEPGAPPAPHGPKSSLPLALVQRSWDTICSPLTPRKAKSTGGGGFPAPPDDFLPPLPPLPPLDDPELPPPPLEDPELPPPPLDFMEPPSPGLRARSPSGGQEAAYAPPSQQARSINVQNQHMNKTNE